MKDASAQPSTTPEKSTTTETPKVEAKPEDTLAAKAAEGEKKPEAAGVPDKYEFKAPEGYEIDQAFLDKATPVLKELGISQEGAQKLFETVQDKITNAQQDLIDFYETTREGWRKEIVADKAIGDGKGGLLPAVSQNISAAISALPADLQTPFKDAMNLTGAGDHPAFVRAMSVIGAAFREGKLVAGKGPSPTGQTAPGAKPASAAAALYPNLPSSAS